jgi:hypothetical protein
MLALYRHPKKDRRKKAKEWGAIGLQRQKRHRIEAGPDAETERMRAMNDRRGQRFRHGTTYFPDGRIVAWEIVHSVAGTINQFDILVDGLLWKTGGQEIIEEHMKK